MKKCKIPVTLPHDAMIYEPCSSKNTAGLGYYPGGSYRYEKRWIPDAGCETQLLEFEGVYGYTIVYMNGKTAVTNVYGYTGFFVDLTPYLIPNQENVIEVLADNSRQPNSRWYSVRVSIVMSGYGRERTVLLPESATASTGGRWRLFVLTVVPVQLPLRYLQVV